ncbi:MAG: twin-arginine translocase TatA/TatE family subunit [Chloroflexi bacterium]|nr:twin-arginine translocase TatA/TatE family subunit [Chloroflexota bacterium]
MPTLGTTELIIILVIVLILFGGSRLGQLGGSLGRGIREFRESVRDEDAAAKEKDKESRPAASQAAASSDGSGAKPSAAGEGTPAAVRSTDTKPSDN